MLGELFDSGQEYAVHYRLRPHWAQTNSIVFVTFRTKDSIPVEVLKRWDLEKQDWVDRVLSANHQSRREIAIESTESRSDRSAVNIREHWSDRLQFLTPRQRREFDFTFNRCREKKLDESLGDCELKHPEIAKIVADSLLFFDGDRYHMGDFIVMPNHVHLLAAFSSPEMMERQYRSWLHYTATKINKRFNRTGHFWQQEPFDHLVRSIEQYEYLRRYIEQNPRKAKLKEGEFFYRRLID